MPRWACREVLEVTGLRIERLCAGTEADALAEGFETREQFIGDFLSIYTGTAKMWVWVVGFNRTEVANG